MAVDVRKLLSVPMDTIKAPEALPEGHYIGRVKTYEVLESSQKKTPFVRFTVGIESAKEDVDPAAIAEIDLSKKQMRKDYYLTPDSMFRIKNFIESCKINTSGRELDACLPETLQQLVELHVTQRNSEDGQSTFNDVKDMIGA